MMVEDNEISVILNVYKRPHTLEKQIDAVLNQSVKIKPENIHVWYNRSNVQQILPKNKNIKTYVTNWNSKFHGRFTIPLLINTKYIAMFDDDSLPQKNWFKNCLDTMKIHEGILGGAGIITNNGKSHDYQKVGWNGIHSDQPIEVDFVGHAWFFKQEWTKHMWNEEPINRDNGEDMQFSFFCQKNEIKTFVPPHPEDDKTLWSTDYKFGMSVGSDNNASFKAHASTFAIERNNIIKELINNGWKTVNL